MNDPQKLREISWQRPLTAGEQAELQAWLAAHPESRADWELELALTRELTDLPEAPVGSNFTALVLREIERQPAPVRFWKWQWSWRSLAPKAAILALICGGMVFVSQQRAMARRVELAQSVATISKVSSLPSPEILQNFEVIRCLNFNPLPDEKLIAVMK